MDFKDMTKLEKIEAEKIKKAAHEKDLAEKAKQAQKVGSLAVDNKKEGFHCYRTTSRTGLLPEQEIVEFLSSIKAPIKSWSVLCLTTSIMSVVYEIGKTEDIKKNKSNN